MTTLADLIDDAARKLTYSVKVNGVPLVASSQAAGLGQLTGVPAVLGFGWDDATAQIRVNRCPSWMRAGMSVTIDAGFNGLNMRVFTGYVIALPGEEPDYLRSKVIVRGATVQVGTPPDDVPVELTATATLVGADIQPPLPDGTNIEHEISVPLVTDSARLSTIATRELSRYGVVPRHPSGQPNEQIIQCGGELHKAARAYQLDAISLDGFTDQDAILLICDLVGITKRSLIEPPEGWYTLDVGASVQRGRPLDMLSELMKIGGLEAYHTEDGTVIFRQVDFAPGPSHAWEYSTSDQTKARVLSAPGELEVLFNPFVRKYSTGLLTLPFLNFDGTRVFARAVRHAVGEGVSGGAATYIDAWGGSRLGGTIAIDPIAAFTFQVEREIIGDGIYIVYSCDASSSFDPDGSIASYAWTCNRTTTPASLGTAVRTTFRVAATVATPLTLTLTVTDNDGNTHAVSVDLPTTADATEMQIPAIFAALKNRMSATPDGGSNWNDISALSGDETSVDAKPADGVNSGIACYGYTDGSIKRTTDFAVTSTTVLAADAANGTINEIWWDKNVTTRVWAGTSTGRLLRSDDNGVTWAVHKAFATNEPIYRIATPFPKGVWVFGGRGDDTSTLMRYEADIGSGAWQSVAVGGDLATALVGAGAALHVRSAAGRMAGELIILLNGTVPAGSQDNIFYTANVFDPTGASWTAATGLTAGLTDGREIVPDEAQGTFRAFFGNRSVWNTTNGIAFTETTNVLPAGFTPNRVLWLGDYTGHAGTYLIAAEDAGFTGAIYKWLSSEATADELRPATGFATWPVSAAGKGIAIGAQLTTVTTDEQLVAVGEDVSPRESSRWQGASWDAAIAITGQTSTEAEIWPLKRNVWFSLPYDGGSFWVEASKGMGSRTTDGGDTWAATPSPAGLHATASASCVAVDAGGRIWLAVTETVTTPITKLFYSDDNGATWTLSTTHGVDGGLQSRVLRIIPHPTNQNVIAVLALTQGGNSGATLITTNRGAAWTTNVNSALYSGTLQERHYFDALMLPTGRIIFHGFNFGGGGTWKWYYSDDYGVTYTAPSGLTLSGAGSHYSHIWRDSGGVRLAVWHRAYSGSLSDDVTLATSSDGGKTWATVATVTLTNWFSAVSSIHIMSDWSPARPEIEAFYVLRESATSEIKRVAPLNSTVAVTATLSAGLPHAAFPDSSWPIIAPIPRT